MDTAQQNGCLHPQVFQPWTIDSKQVNQSHCSSCVSTGLQLGLKPTPFRLVILTNTKNYIFGSVLKKQLIILTTLEGAKIQMYNVVREVIMLRILKGKSFFMCCLFKDKQQLFIQLLNLQTGCFYTVRQYKNSF